MPTQGQSMAAFVIEMITMSIMYDRPGECSPEKDCLR